jgi:hypothetical protein
MQQLIKLYSFIGVLICFSACKEADRLENYTLWTGPNKQFIKLAGADPNDLSNQDSITSVVSITRGNTGGEIYNATVENQADKGLSPVGTEWAIGLAGDIPTLSFSSFRNAVGSPQSVVGKDLIVHLLEDDVYLTVKFTSWSNNQSGGFSYNRSTEN